MDPAPDSIYIFKNSKVRLSSVQRKPLPGEDRRASQVRRSDRREMYKLQANLHAAEVTQKAGHYAGPLHAPINCESGSMFRVERSHELRAKESKKPSKDAKLPPKGKLVQNRFTKISSWGTISGAPHLP